MEEAQMLLGEASAVDTLDHLPIAAAFGHQLKLIEIIDELCPPHPDHAVTHGQCIFAIVLSILAGRYALYEIADWLKDIARDTLFGEDLDASHFHDTRLAAALDAIYQAGSLKLFSTIVLHAIEYYRIQTHRLHGDTTSVSVYGEYAQAEPEALKLLHGHSKDYRPDLKQLIFGLVVSGDGGVPVLGQLHDGNQSDHVTNRWQLTQLRSVIPNLEETTLVYDSKFFDAKTLGLAKEQGVHWITLVPAISNKRAEMMGKIVEQGATLPELRRKPGRRKGEEETFRGSSLVDAVEIELPQQEENAEELPIREQMTVRYLVVHSTQLERQHAHALEKRIAKEQENLCKALEKLQQRQFSCQEDALREAVKWTKTNDPDYHQVPFTVKSIIKKAKRGRKGRPRKEEQPGLLEEWVLEGSLELDTEAIQEEEGALGYFVLATNHLDQADVSDVDILEWYKEQDQVEGRFSWLKGPAAVAPIFLKKPQRIMAIGVVFLMTLMIYTLIEREIRRELAQRQETIPGNNNVATQRPTTAVVFKHFQGIRRVQWEVDGQARGFIQGFTQLHECILNLLGLTTKVFTLSAKILTAPA
jgi:transposase